MVEKEKQRFSLGNRKLPSTTAIFNLPEIETCPGRTALCEKICYAVKASKMYKNVAPHRLSNYAWVNNYLDTPTGWMLLGDELAARIQKLPAKVNTVRIHEAGDFFTEDYVTAWLDAASQCPDIQFYAYTRSYEIVNRAVIDWDIDTRLPSNFILLASLDTTTDMLTKASIQARYDYTGHIKRDRFDYFKYYGADMPWWCHTFEIVQKGKISNCIQDCTKCNMCFNPKLKNRKLKLKVEAH